MVGPVREGRIVVEVAAVPGALVVVVGDDGGRVVDVVVAGTRVVVVGNTVEDVLVVGATDVVVDEVVVVTWKVIWLPPTATTFPVSALVAKGMRNDG
jgi:hypothetical protein